MNRFRPSLTRRRRTARAGVASVERDPAVLLTLGLETFGDRRLLERFDGSPPEYRLRILRRRHVESDAGSGVRSNDPEQYSGTREICGDFPAQLERIREGALVPIRLRSRADRL
jgi:hypothetical protein